MRCNERLPSDLSRDIRVLHGNNSTIFLGCAGSFCARRMRPPLAEGTNLLCIQFWALLYNSSRGCDAPVMEPWWFSYQSNSVVSTRLKGRCGRSDDCHLLASLLGNDLLAGRSSGVGCRDQIGCCCADAVWWDRMCVRWATGWQQLLICNVARHTA